MFLCEDSMEGGSRKVVIKYDPGNVDSGFWQRLSGYSKGRYRYPGLIDVVPGVEKIARTVLAVPVDEVERVEGFLRKEGAEFERRGYMEPPEKIVKTPISEPATLNWRMPKEVLRERLWGLGEKMDELGPFIRTKTVRNALEDVKKYGF